MVNVRRPVRVELERTCGPLPLVVGVSREGGPYALVVQVLRRSLLVHPQVVQGRAPCLLGSIVGVPVRSSAEDCSLTVCVTEQV